VILSLLYLQECYPDMDPDLSGNGIKYETKIYYEKYDFCVSEQRDQLVTF